MQCPRQRRGSYEGEGLLSFSGPMLFLEFSTLRFAQRRQAWIGEGMEFIAQVVEALGVADEVYLRLRRHNASSSE
jgi:hypothetical protein